MALITSISGIRGTIGGNIGENLTPIDIVKFVSAYSKWIFNRSDDNKPVVVVGRDARVSGELVKYLVNGTLCACGIDVIDIDLASTPTTEMAVTYFKANGGLILTASHNPMQWNALKMLNSKGEFLNAIEGEEILSLANKSDFNYSEVNSIGKVKSVEFIDEHINDILALDLVSVESIKDCNFKVVVDGINSVGAIIIPKLLKQLGITNIIEVNNEPNGIFAHVAEPLPENVVDTCNMVKKHNADLGIVVDPDVDRLALIDENGVMFGEEYTLVAVADYILRNKKGSTVSNLSSSRALADITKVHGGQYFASAVGEVNVVAKMKEVGAVIGGEGNGGVIYPELHYGRDSLVGVALFLSYIAKRKIKVSELKMEYTQYVMIKDKIQIDKNVDVDLILNNVAKAFSNETVNIIDGVKIDFSNGWVHLRKSNTEPIIRIYCEALSNDSAKNLINKVILVVNKKLT